MVAERADSYWPNTWQARSHSFLTAKPLGVLCLSSMAANSRMSEAVFSGILHWTILPRRGYSQSPSRW